MIILSYIVRVAGTIFFTHRLTCTTYYNDTPIQYQYNIEPIQVANRFLTRPVNHTNALEYN